MVRQELGRAVALAAALAASAACGPPTINVGTPFVVSSTVPVATQTGVGRDVLPRVSFDRPVVTATAETGIQLLVAGAAVDRVITPRDNGKVIELIPRHLLPADTDVTLEIGGTVESTDGVALESSVDVKFHTGP